MNLFLLITCLLQFSVLNSCQQYIVDNSTYKVLKILQDNLYEADIVLSDDDKRQVDQREEGDADGLGNGDVIKRNAIRNRQKLWKTRVVPYRISPALCKYE